jgi:tRNA(Phe) wybutosine-synthesizing methylase Tyw3
MKRNSKQIERIVKTAEKAARGYIASKVSSKETEDLEIAVEVETNDELKIDIEVSLDTLLDKTDCHELVEGAVEAAHEAIKNELDRLRTS